MLAGLAAQRVGELLRLGRGAGLAGAGGTRAE
jgi:hypothetical protein